jgi:hypothetical protein
MINGKKTSGKGKPKMISPKIGAFLLVLTLLLTVMASGSVSHIINDQRPKTPMFDWSVTGSSYTYDTINNVINIIGNVGYINNTTTDSSRKEIYWVLSKTPAGYSNWDPWIGHSPVYLSPSQTKTISTVIDLDTASRMVVEPGAVYYVAIVTPLFPGEMIYSNNYYNFPNTVFISIDTMSPTIAFSQPDSGAVNVPANTPVVIGFTEKMDTASFSFTITPNPGGVSYTWNTGCYTLSISHLDFANSVAETINIAHAEDLSGNLLVGLSRIIFNITANQDPVITMKTQPSSPQTIGRPYLVQAVIKDPVKNLGRSITADSIIYRVDGGDWSQLGAVGIKGDTFNFRIPAIDSGWVEYYLQAWNNAGATTVEPSAGYDSFSVNTVAPVITYSTPDSGAVNVAVNAPILIAFSAPIDTATFTFAILPDPGGVNGAWNGDHDTLRILHAAFADDTPETINITQAADPFGHPLAGRSVITFTTQRSPNQYWDDRFYTPGGLGMNGAVLALADSGNNVYAGGRLTMARAGLPWATV